jgi:hypothetical protein
METFAVIAFIISAITVVPAFLASIYCSYALNRYVRQSHPEIWAKIAPQPMAQPSLSSASTRFITQRKYRDINDNQLNVLGDRCFRLLYFAATVFLILILSGLASSAPK